MKVTSLTATEIESKPDVDKIRLTVSPHLVTWRLCGSAESGRGGKINQLDGPARGREVTFDPHQAWISDERELQEERVRLHYYEEALRGEGLVPSN